VTLLVILLFQIYTKSYSQALNVTKIVTDFGGYWSSTNGSNTIFPDTSHDGTTFLSSKISDGIKKSYHD
jgi:hypothetical protein